MSGIVNSVIDFLTGILAKILDFLPDSPFANLTLPSGVETILGYMNYFIPLSELAVTMALWCAAIGLHYCYMAIMRWIKAIE